MDTDYAADIAALETRIARCLYKLNHRREERPRWLTRERRRLWRLIGERVALERAQAQARRVLEVAA